MRRIKRSALRIFLGRMFYTHLRYLQWIINNKSFAKLSSSMEGKSFQHIIFQHKSPLFRGLKDTELWMDLNKIHNLNLAIKKLNGLILQPGMTLSYWKLIGAPYTYRGFKKGMVLVNGQAQCKTGGGLCQLSNLLYWMTLHTPLSVTQRFRHSYDVFPDSNRTQPFGSGATCVYNYRDLQIRNDSVEPFLLNVYLDESHLHGQWLAQNPGVFNYRVYEEKHWISQQQGFYIRNNILRRKILKESEEVEDQYITENHALMMYSPLIDAPQSFMPKEAGL